MGRKFSIDIPKLVSLRTSYVNATLRLCRATVPSRAIWLTESCLTENRHQERRQTGRRLDTRLASNANSEKHTAASERP
jgi:hypothetical protein